MYDPSSPAAQVCIPHFCSTGITYILAGASVGSGIGSMLLMTAGMCCHCFFKVHLFCTAFYQGHAMPCKDTRPVVAPPRLLPVALLLAHMLLKCPCSPLPSVLLTAQLSDQPLYSDQLSFFLALWLVWWCCPVLEYCVFRPPVYSIVILCLVVG